MFLLVPYRPTQGVQDNEPLNGCVCVRACVRACVCMNDQVLLKNEWIHMLQSTWLVCSAAAAAADMRY